MIGVVLIIGVNAAYVIVNRSVPDLVVLAAGVLAAIAAEFLKNRRNGWKTEDLNSKGRDNRATNTRVAAKTGVEQHQIPIEETIGREIHESEFSKDRKWNVLAGVILFTSLLLRCIYVLWIHETPQMDFRRYYEVAGMILHGTDPAGVYYNYGISYLDFLSAFPFTLGYSAVLSLVFRLFGESWQAAELFNVFCSGVSLILVYHIVQRISGKKAAFTSLVLAACWPSMFLYSNMISSESCFTMLLLFAADIFVCVQGKFKSLGKPKSSAPDNLSGEFIRPSASEETYGRLPISSAPKMFSQGFLLIVGMAAAGLILGLASWIRSMAVLLLVTFLIVLVVEMIQDLRDEERRNDKGGRGCLRTDGKNPSIRREDFGDLEEIPRNLRVSSPESIIIGKLSEKPEEQEDQSGRNSKKSAKSGLICVGLYAAAIACMIICYGGVKHRTETWNQSWIGPSAASSQSAGGYSFLVGMNLESNGGYYREDLDFVFEGLRETGSGTIAQERCRNAAFERLHSMSFPDAVHLFFAKYNRIWRTDDFGAVWNRSLMLSDGTLTERWKSVWGLLGRVSTAWFLAAALLAGIRAFRMIRRKQIDLSIVFVILTLGCAATHTIMESQNRYHYYTLYCFAVLAAEELSESKEIVSRKE